MNNKILTLSEASSFFSELRLKGKKIVQELHQHRRDIILTSLLNLLEELEKTPIRLSKHGPLFKHTGVERCDLLREAKVSLAGAYATIIPQKDRPKHLNKLSHVRGFLMHTQTLNPKENHDVQILLNLYQYILSSNLQKRFCENLHNGDTLKMKKLLP